MKRIAFLLFLLAFSIAGCGIYGMTQSNSKPTADQISRADYGDPPANYQDQIRSYLNSNLVNAVGVILELGQTYKAWAQLSKNPSASPAMIGAYGVKNAFGWSVCGYINAQNRFGGYAGRDMFWMDILSEWNAGKGGRPYITQLT